VCLEKKKKGGGKVNQIVLTVDKQAVIRQRKWIQTLCCQANLINVDSTYKVLNDAANTLNKAVGIYITLDEFELLEPKDSERIKEDIERIENKIFYLKEEKKKARLTANKSSQ
jgi:hypothetical protein